MVLLYNNSNNPNIPNIPDKSIQTEWLRKSQLLKGYQTTLNEITTSDPSNYLSSNSPQHHANLKQLINKLGYTSLTTPVSISTAEVDKSCPGVVKSSDPLVLSLYKESGIQSDLKIMREMLEGLQPGQLNLVITLKTLITL